MLKLFIKTLLFCLPVIVFMLIPSVTHYIMDADLEAKVNTFLPADNTVQIIIAGESRAERQLIPAIFEEELRLETVNIAKEIGDVTSLLYANYKYNFIDSSKIIIMCLSSLLTNDGAYDNWYMSQTSITEIGFLKSVFLFKSDYFENWYRRMGLIWDDLRNDKRGILLQSDDIRIANEGYLPIDKKLDKAALEKHDLIPETTLHLWYRKPNNTGIRKNIFEESVNKLAKSGIKIVLIQSPMAPTWRKIVGENYMHQLELEHSLLLKKLAAQHDNIWSVDFYANQPPIFTDEYFYNATHTNIYGAIVFTNAVIDSLVSKGIIH